MLVDAVVTVAPGAGVRFVTVGGSGVGPGCENRYIKRLAICTALSIAHRCVTTNLPTKCRSD